MNKSDLILAIAQETNLAKSDTEKFFDSMVNVIVRNVKKGDKIAIPGFIIFTKVKRAARIGRNLKTGEKVKIAARNAVKIKVSKKFMNAVN